jgi:hypothetical protein
MILQKSFCTPSEGNLQPDLDTTKGFLVRLNTITPRAVVVMVIVLDLGLADRLPQHRGRNLSGVRGISVVQVLTRSVYEKNNG